MKTNNKNQRFWTCIIGPAYKKDLDNYADAPLRQAVKKSFFDTFSRNAHICMSGWGSNSVDEAKKDLDRQFIYAVKETCCGKPKLKELTTGELLKTLTNFAKDYVKEAPESVIHNKHMNDLTPRTVVEKRMTDAVVVDFINYIGLQYGVDYGLHTYHLSEVNNENKLWPKIKV